MAKLVIKLDLETTADGGPNNDSPEAHWRVNKVLMCGWSCINTGLVMDSNVNKLCDTVQNNIDIGNEVTLVAHNAKFDIKYLMRDRPDVQWEKVHVWDTMTWEYRQSGHFVKFSSLEDTALRRGVKFKKQLDLGALIAKGVKMQDIPSGQLRDYLEEDVRVLSQVYEEQYNLMDGWDMDYILPLAEMELNGLHINKNRAMTMLIDETKKMDAIQDKLEEYIKVCCEWQDGSPIVDEDFSNKIGTKSKYIKATAARTISFLLTGEPEELKITNKWRAQYKAGCQPYYDTVTMPLPTVFKDANHLGYPVGEEVLGSLNDWISSFALRHRSASKLVGTYLAPFLSVSGVQDCVYPKLNTTTTGTGRLSSSAPNGQNIPPVIRALVEPREAGDSIIEIDFSQLEIVGVACVSGCKELINDLCNGVDVHYRSGKKVFGWTDPSDMTEKDRKVVKNVNFGLLYGGKAGGLAKQTGVSKDIVQALIDSFYEAYPGIKTWQKQVFTEVTQHMYPHHISDRGEQVYAAEYNDSFSGRRFLFVEQKAPSWIRAKTGRGFSFSPQQTSNYPIQGFAGGDIVMIALTELWRAMRGYVKFIMTVHDSIIMEGHDTSNLRQAMDEACEAVKKRFNLPVDLKYDVTTGQHWS